MKIDLGVLTAVFTSVVLLIGLLKIRSEQKKNVSLMERFDAVVSSGEINHEPEAQRERIRTLERKARFDLDVRGLLAVVALVLSFALAIMQLLLKGNADIPAWAAAVVTGIAGFYFGSRGGGMNGGTKP